MKPLFLWLGFHQFPVPHEGSESFRDDDGAILSLVLFTDSDDHPRHSTAGPVERVLVSPGLVPDVQPPGLEVSTVAAGADLPPEGPAGEPGLDIKLGTGGTAELLTTHVQHTVDKTQRAEHLALWTRQSVSVSRSGQVRSGDQFN